MKPTLKAGMELGAAVGGPAIFGHWLTGAGSELAGAEAAAPGPARWFAAAGAGAWGRELLADCPDDAGREAVAANLRRAAGGAGTVVTGQQPGFMGGPLYTLYKCATAIVLARRLSTPSAPVVPVFWSGDDDEDLLEALEPVAVRPGGDVLVRSEQAAAVRAAGRRPRMVGRLRASFGQRSAAPWFASLPAAADSRQLGRLWETALAADWTWARLARAALLRVFAGQGLLIVSGDDPRLHEAAAPLYAGFGARRAELAGLVAARGRELEAAGWHAQLGPRALGRALFRVEDSRRHPWNGPVPTATGDLRPGVMLRSPVQDYLLAPRAVVVGPGELAYLRQLDPLYAALGVPRSPLVPRLFAWLLPTGFAPELLAQHRAGSGPDTAEVARVVAAFEQQAGSALVSALTAELGLAADASAALAARRFGRWRRGLTGAIEGACRQQSRARRPVSPAWVFPDGRRQERRLAWAAALALGGEQLEQAVLAAAAAHLREGARGNWCEWEITLDNSEGRRA